MRQVRFAGQTSYSDRGAGKGREGVNLSPGIGDWGFCSGSPRSEAKFLGGHVFEEGSRVDTVLVKRLT